MKIGTALITPLFMLFLFFTCTSQFGQHCKSRPTQGTQGCQNLSQLPPPGGWGTEEDTVRQWGTSVPFIQWGTTEDIVFQPQITINPFIRNFSNSQAHRQKSLILELVSTLLDPHLQNTAVCLFQSDLPSTEPLFSLFCPPILTFYTRTLILYN